MSDTIAEPKEETAFLDLHKKFVEENLNLILCLCATCNNLLVIVQIEFLFF